MRNALLLALVTLPLVACSAAVEDGASDENVGTSQNEIANPYPTSYLVNFDRDPAGNALADGTIVDSVYTAAYDVTFSGMACTPGATPSCVSGHAFARSTVGPASAPNVVSIDASSVPVFDARFGRIQADFGSPRVWVSIDVEPVPFVADALGAPDGYPWLEAYDANGIKVAEVTYAGHYGDPDYFSFHTLRIDAGSARIKSVRFSVHPSSNGPELFGAFDNLRFNTSNAGPPRPICLYRIGC